MIIWGTKKVKSKLGFVAENCSRCRSIQVMKVSRVGMAGHIYYIPTSKGRLLGFVGECQQCSGEFWVQPTDYPAFEKNKKAELSALITKTNPKLLPGNKAAIDSFVRFSQVREPLLRFNQSLEDRYAAGTRFDFPIVLALLVMFALPIPFGMAVNSISFLGEAREHLGGMVMGITFFVGLIATVYLTYKEPQRFFQKNLYRQITNALKPINPRPDELKECLSALRKYDYRICRHVTADSLLRGMRSTTNA